MTQNVSRRLKKKRADDPLVGWYGGHPRGIRAQDWPRCRVCGEPLCHMGQINGGPWMDLEPFKRMSLFICHATGGHCEDWDPYKGSNRVILHREQNNMLFDGPPTVRVYRRLKISIDGPVDEGSIWSAPEAERAAAAEALRYDKVGGEAVWVHQDAVPTGRDGQPMGLLLQMTTSLVRFDITQRGMAYVFLDRSTGYEPSAYLLWQGN